jgi:hypothetical protein
MPSCRHSPCDGTESALTSENAACDGIGECRHTASETAPAVANPGGAGDAVTDRKSESKVTGRADSSGSGAVIPTPREELITQAIANMGRLTGEQRDLLALLLPPPDQRG